MLLGKVDPSSQHLGLSVMKRMRKSRKEKRKKRKKKRKKEKMAKEMLGEVEISAFS